jgi:hypothetical protein
LSKEINLLYSPLIKNVSASGNEDKSGVNINITGDSLFKCGKLWLEVK